jgi:hypothetical protein
MPVMNADFDAVVYFRPMFCEMNPRNKKRPRILPLMTDARGIGKSVLRKMRRKIRAAVANRVATFMSGVVSTRMNFIATNVLPQISVVARRASSALDLEVNLVGSRNYALST